MSPDLQRFFSTITTMSPGVSVMVARLNDDTWKVSFIGTAYGQQTRYDATGPTLEAALRGRPIKVETGDIERLT